MRLRLLGIFMISKLVMAAPLANTAASTSLVESSAKLAPNLGAVDSNVNDLNQLKRRLEIEKAAAEIKKLNAPTERSADNAQTTVTGVAINHEGYKMAWLQFADGGTLTVNIGSKIGKYTVADINMTGVTLSHSGGKTIYLKRAYPLVELRKATGSPTLFAPSPIVTGANNSINVPPIIQGR